MSRSEKYLPYLIALLAPAINLISTSLFIDDFQTNALVINYFQTSILLLVLWYLNKWLLDISSRLNGALSKYILIISVNFVLISFVSFIGGTDYTGVLGNFAPYFIIFRLSLVILIFHVILKVFSAQKEKSRLEVLNLSLQSENLKFQMDTLKQQINPHFLFNSLNTLLDLIEDDKKKAVEFVRSFSSLYRIVLQSVKHDFITVEEELEFLDDYWNLLKVRFQETIQLKVDISTKKRILLIPPLSLQFLIENAVKHNQASKKKPLVIEIFETGDKITVRNNLCPKSYQVKSDKVGLINLQQRFTLLIEPISYQDKEGYFSVVLPLKQVLT